MHTPASPLLQFMPKEYLLSPALGQQEQGLPSSRQADAGRRGWSPPLSSSSGQNLMEEGRWALFVELCV